jgi:hypothetical protein
MVRRFWTAIALTGLLATGAGAAEPTVLAEAKPRGVAVDWTVLSPYRRAVLTVSMPDGEVARSEVGPGSGPTFSAFDEDGEPRPDGAYNWELRLDPVVAPDLEQRLAAALARGDERAARRIRRDQGLDRELVQSGTLLLSGGVFLTGEEAAAPDGERPAEKLGSVTDADHFIVDDLIVNGNACVGLCGNGMSFPIAPFVVRATSPNLLFDDVSPDYDWAFIVNGFFGGSNRFALFDLGSSKVPFTITGGAPSSSLFVDSQGRVGMGTSTPARALHIRHPDAGVRLEGFKTWEMYVNTEALTIRNATSGMLPFRIAHGAPSNSFHVAASGNVGLGTTFPEVDLHVYGGNTTDTVLGVGPSPDGNPGDVSALNVGYGGASFGRGAAFLNVRPDSGAAAPNPSLRFLVANTQRMILDNEGFLGLGVPNPANPIQHSSGAVLTAGGTWQSVSSRASKRDIRSLDASDALAALAGLEPVRFYYKAEPGDEYVGFVAEDVPDLVASGDHERLGPLDIVAVLTKVVQQQQRALQEQQATNAALAARLAELERRQAERPR